MDFGMLGKIGRWARAHRRLMIAAWAVLTVSLGVFAPSAEHALSGAMWEVDGSESLRAREIIDDQFGGMSSQSAVVVLHSVHGGHRFGRRSTRRPPGGRGRVPVLPP
jgi:RND superfamily putative drug exporter